MIETYIIEQLAVLAEYKTLSRVAEELHTSQPALSHAMQKLEGELGVEYKTLFEPQNTEQSENFSDLSKHILETKLISAITDTIHNEFKA